MNELNLQHHVKLRDSLRKKQIRISSEIYALRSIDLTKYNPLSQNLFKSELEYREAQLDQLQSDINQQQEIIDEYMDSLE